MLSSSSSSRASPDKQPVATLAPPPTPPLQPFEYYDAGNHWCKNCNITSGSMFDFFTHLHSKTHRKVCSCFLLHFYATCLSRYTTVQKSVISSSSSVVTEIKTQMADVLLTCSCFDPPTADTLCSHSASAHSGLCHFLLKHQTTLN